MLDLTVTPSSAVDVQLRPARPSDERTLAELMLDAYRGTIDCDDETTVEAIAEIEPYLRGERGGAPMLDVSRLAISEEILVSACLVTEWDERHQPLIAYVMNKANSKNHGLARQVLSAVMNELKAGGAYGSWRRYH